MSKDTFTIIDEQINKLIHDTSPYNFEHLKKKIEAILDGVEIFMVDNQLNPKAVDLYVKKVITKKNELQKQQEQSKVVDDKQSKYLLIEAICKKCDFQTKEELIQKIEELETKSLLALKDMLNS